MSTTARADTARENPWDALEGALMEPEYANLRRDQARDVIDIVTELDFRPSARVISGDVESVTAALDGLPVGSIITCDEGGLDLVYHCTSRASVWDTAGRLWQCSSHSSVESSHIARHQVPITVLREGTGA